LDTDSFRRHRTLVAALWLVVAGYAALEAWNQVEGRRDAARGATPRYSDYTHTYGASVLAHEAAVEFLYLPRVMSQASRYAAHAMYPGISEEQARAVGFSPFMYPPTFIPIVATLAFFPYLLSWLLWLGVTAVPYLAAMRRILPGPLSWPAALAAPPVYYNVKYGQTGFLSAGLIGLGLHLLWRRPLWAGVLIGLASVKPNLGVLIPLALLAGGHWRAFVAATATALAMIAATLFAYGDEPWFAFIGTLSFHLEGFAHGAYNYTPMTTVLATLRLAGVPLDVAWLVQYASATLMAALVAWTWWRGRKRADLAGLQAAVLCLATPLALPSAYLYDLVLLVPAAVWMWQAMDARGAPAWEYRALIGACAALLAVNPLAEALGVQTGAALIGLLLALALRRYRLALRESATAATADTPSS
jgi:alpha-1,2-mannosyltransferase